MAGFRQPPCLLYNEYFWGVNDSKICYNYLMDEGQKKILVSIAVFLGVIITFAALLYIGMLLFTRDFDYFNILKAY